MLERGDVVGGAYRVEARIGGGGMGAVYRARRLTDDRAVALKVVRERAPELVARLEREARITGSIDHPNMIRVHDVLRDEDGSPIVVMELLHGETLGQRLARERILPVGELARIAIGIIGALEAAHARSVVHRDLKPDNVFLTSVDGEPFVKVLDFGIAKAVEGTGVIDGLATLETRTGQILGTPQYMAPEQIFGEKDVDHRADIWALGVVLYEALAGKRPFDGDNVGQVFKAIALDPPVPLAKRRGDLPPALLAIVGQMLTHARDERSARLAEVRAALLPFVDDAKLAPRDAGTAATVEVALALALRPPAVPRAELGSEDRVAPRSPRPWVLGGLALTAVVGGIAWLGRPPPSVASAPAPTAIIATAPATASEVSPAEQKRQPVAAPLPSTRDLASSTVTPNRTKPTAAPSPSIVPPRAEGAATAAPRVPRSGPLRRDEF